MFELDVTYAGLERIERGLDRAARFDLHPVAEKLRGRLIEGNRRGLLAGTDADGNKTADLAESTLRDPRRGDGPARVPQSEESRLIKDFQATPDVLGPDRISVTGHWPNTPFVRFHREPDKRPRRITQGDDQSEGGSVRRPARDPVGVRPDDMALISGDIRETADLLLRF